MTITEQAPDGPILVSLDDLAMKTSDIIQLVNDEDRPVIVTRQGRLIARIDGLVNAGVDETILGKLLAELTTIELNVNCAYCRKPTAPEDQATPPWEWPGRGLVTNCKNCAGIVKCGVCGREWDGAEARARNGDPCPDCD